MRQYPYFGRLFHTSTPLRSMELSKELQGVSACGKSATISLLPQTFPHFHTSEKCGTKYEKGKYGSCGQHWTFVSRGGKKTLGRTVHDNVVAINYLLDNIWVFFVSNSDCWHFSVVQKENLVLQ